MGLSEGGAPVSPGARTGTHWFDDAVLYQVYPQSFADSDGDGIGDLRGVIERLEYIESLGVNTLWFNPCFTSPFVDAGYDVADYLTIAPRYGTNDDMVELVAEAKRRGIRVMLDLVAGHTSIDHPWFQDELHADGPSPLGDRYVWSSIEPTSRWDDDVPGTPAWVPSPGPRPGWYLKNFYDEQPALNFGWASGRGPEPWRSAIDDPGPQRNVLALQDIMAFWLERDIAGFRIDMAFSLVKDDQQDQRGRGMSARLWRRIRDWLDTAYPDAVLIPEGVELRTASGLAFDADFFLVIHRQHASLFDNHHAGVLPFQAPTEPFFDAAGRGTTALFLDSWDAIRNEFGDRHIVMGTADHDFSRLCCGPRTSEQLGAALTFLLTWGSVPCIWYGDEIGMRYVPDLPDVEGAMCNVAYNRAGCRTPMQWDDSPNAGFSTADPSALYLPIDPDPTRPTVAAQERDPHSTLQLVRRLLALRSGTPALRTHATTRVLHAGYPFVYLRGTTHLVVTNPRRAPATFSTHLAVGATGLLADGVSLSETILSVDGFGYGIFALAGAPASFDG